MLRSIAILSLLLGTTAAVAQDDTASQDASGQDTASQETPATEESQPAAFPASGPLIRAEAVEESKVYSLDENYNETFWNSGDPFGDVAASWLEIGEVEDLVLDNEAKVVGVTVDVGGFLGIGERRVLIPLQDIRLVQTPNDDEFMIVTRMAQSQLEEAEAVGPLIGDD